MASDAINPIPHPDLNESAIGDLAARDLYARHCAAYEAADDLLSELDAEAAVTADRLRIVAEYDAGAAAELRGLVADRIADVQALEVDCEGCGGTLATAGAECVACDGPTRDKLIELFYALKEALAK